MTYSYVEYNDTNLLWNTTSGMIVFLLIRRNLRRTDSFKKFENAWHFWRWEWEGSGGFRLNKALADSLFMNDFIESIEKSICEIEDFGEKISKDYLNELDDLQELKLINDYKKEKILQCLKELYELIKK